MELKEARRNYPAFSVILTGVAPPEQWREATTAWLSQTYPGRLELVAVQDPLLSYDEFSRLGGLARAVIARGQAAWNPAWARNTGAWLSNGQGLVFAPPYALPTPEFVTEVHRRWDAADAWLPDVLARGLPCSPQLGECLAIKRWLNTRLRGFNETMFAVTHGWGYDDVDYRLRLQACARSGLGVVGDYPADLVQWLPVTDDTRSAPFVMKDLEASYAAHAAWSKERLAVGWEGNVSADWGASYGAESVQRV